MSDDLYLWLDLETTGLEVDAEIVEVAAILTRFNGTGFDQLGRYHAVRALTGKVYDRMGKFVRDMHAGTGLLTEMATAPQHLSQIDEGLAAMMKSRLNDAGRGTVHLAGSGVSHFDLAHVKRLMPVTAGWLHWRPLDVGQLEEWRKLQGLPTYDEANPEEAARKTHRAMDDIAYHVDEAQWYLQQTVAAVAGES